MAPVDDEAIVTVVSTMTGGGDVGAGASDRLIDIEDNIPRPRFQLSRFIAVLADELAVEVEDDEETASKALTAPVMGDVAEADAAAAEAASGEIFCCCC